MLKSIIGKNLSIIGRQRLDMDQNCMKFYIYAWIDTYTYACYAQINAFK